MEVQKRFRRVAVVAVVAVVGSSLGMPATGIGRRSSIEEIGALPIFESGSPGRIVAMVLDPTARRGYQITSPIPGFGGNALQLDASSLGDTVLWSYDLDTLRAVRRIVIEDFAPSRIGGFGATGSDVVHAVDESTGTLFLTGLRPSVGGAVTQNAVAVIDEAALDAGAGDAVTFLDTPEAQLPQLAGRNAYGMALQRVDGRPKLVLLLTTDLQGVTGFGDSVPQDSYLVQWDAQTGDPDWTSDGPLPPVGGPAANGVYILASCQEAPLLPFFQEWVHPVGILSHPTGIYLGCQGQRGVNHNTLAVRVTLDGTGRPSGERTFPFEKGMVNVLADAGGGRLYFQVFNTPGLPWVAFDVATQSYVGSAFALRFAGPFANAGLDPRSGRLYSLAPDHLSDVPVQGGLMYTDTRSTPMPEFTNVRPDLAYPAQAPIRVDPNVPGHKRHVFVRRGTASQQTTYVYPTTTQQPAPVEDFFRVYRDTIPTAA